MFEQSEGLVREIRAQIEPLDVVVEVEGAHEDGITVCVGLDKSANRMMLRLEGLPGCGGPNLRPEVQGKILTRGNQARHQERRGDESHSTSTRGCRGEREKRLQALTDEKIDGRDRARGAERLRRLD